MFKKSFFASFLILVITSLMLVGCSFTKEVVQDFKLDHTVSVISQDDNNIIAEITLNNKTDYDFTPLYVFLRPAIGETHILVEAIRTDSGFPKDIKYKVIIPKAIFTLKDVTIEKLSLQFCGFYSDKNKTVVEQISDFNLKELLDKISK